MKLPAAQTLPSLLHPLGASDDDDSVYGGSTAGSDTTSLKSSITRYREENGRSYHSYGSTEHWGPNDSNAQDQQDLTHHLWTLALKGKLYLAPIKTLQRILDLGTGLGIWVVDVGERGRVTEIVVTIRAPAHGRSTQFHPDVRLDAEAGKMK